MKTKTILVLLAALFCVAVRAQTTTFTYQGRLTDNGNPANGIYDLRLTIYDAATNGGSFGTITSSATSVSNGLFTVSLDFGNQFPGANRWLEIEARTNGAGSFTTLVPRQQLTSTPYAVTAGNLSGTVAASGLSGTYSSAVTFSNAANSFSGNGSGLTSLDASQLATGTVPDARLAANIARTNQVWLLNGNTGTTAGANFLGTKDQQPLELKVGGLRTLRFEFNTNGAPNVIGGSPVNTVSAGVVGATISGGGATNISGFNWTNSIASDFGSIGGGLQNEIRTNADYSTIGGGFSNEIDGNADASTIAGGNNNLIQTNVAQGTIGGGNGNVIQTNATRGTISGGNVNTISSNAVESTIAGGHGNTIIVSGTGGAIGGGNGNTAGYYGTVPGGYSCVATGQYSFAAGYNAVAKHNGTFVWADSSSSADFASSLANQFLIRSSFVGINRTNAINGTDFFSVRCPVASQFGGMFIECSGFNSSPFYGYAVAGTQKAYHCVDNADGDKWKLNVGGGDRIIVTTAGNVGIGQTTPTNKLMVVNARCDGSTWINSSDRNLKENFGTVKTREILEKVAELPISTWNYKTDNTSTHLGPVAQDFRAAFALGSDETSISTVDEGGVALAAIQGLNEKLEEQVKEKDAKISELEKRLADLERVVNKLTEVK